MMLHESPAAGRSAACRKHSPWTMERDRKKSKAVLGSPECHEALSEGPEDEENELDDHEMTEQEAHVLACLGQLSVAGLLEAHGGLDGSGLNRAVSAPDGRRKVRGSRALSASYHSRLRSCMLNEKGSPLAPGSKSHIAVADVAGGQENAPPMLFALAEHSKCWIGGRRPSPRTQAGVAAAAASTTATGVLRLSRCSPPQQQSGNCATGSPGSGGSEQEGMKRESGNALLVGSAIATSATELPLSDQTACLPGTGPPRQSTCESPAPPKPRTHRRSHSGANGAELADSAETLHGPHEHNDYNRAGSQPLLSEAAAAAAAAWKQRTEGDGRDDCLGVVAPSCCALSADREGILPRGARCDGGGCDDTSARREPNMGDVRREGAAEIPLQATATVTTTITASAVAPAAPTTAVSKYGIAAFAVPASVHSCFSGPMTASSMQRPMAAPGAVEVLDSMAATAALSHSAAAAVCNPFALVQVGSTGAKIGSAWSSCSSLSGSGALVSSGIGGGGGALQAEANTAAAVSGMLGSMSSAPAVAMRALGVSAAGQVPAGVRYSGHPGVGPGGSAGLGNTLADSAEELELRRMTQARHPRLRSEALPPPHASGRSASSGSAPITAVTAPIPPAAPSDLHSSAGNATPFVAFDLASLARSAGGILAGSASLPCGGGSGLAVTDAAGVSVPLLQPLHISSCKSQPDLRGVFVGHAAAEGSDGRASHIIINPNNNRNNHFLSCNHSFMPCRSSGSNDNQPRSEAVVDPTVASETADQPCGDGHMEHDDDCDDIAALGSDRYGSTVVAPGEGGKSLLTHTKAERGVKVGDDTAAADTEPQDGINARRDQGVQDDGGDHDDKGDDDEVDEDGTPWLRTSQQAPDPDDPSSAGKYSAVLLRRLQAAAAHEELYGVPGAGHTGLLPNYLQASCNSVQSLGDFATGGGGGRRLGSDNHSCSSVEPSPMPRLSSRMRRLRASPCGGGGGGGSSGGGSAGTLPSPAPFQLGTRSRSAGVTPGTDRRLRRRSELVPDLFGGRRRGEVGENECDEFDIGHYADCCFRDIDTAAAAGDDDHLMSDAVRHDHHEHQQLQQQQRRHSGNASQAAAEAAVGPATGRQLEELLRGVRCRTVQLPPSSTGAAFSWLVGGGGGGGVGLLHHSTSQPGLAPSEGRRWHPAAVLPKSARDLPTGARVQSPMGRGRGGATMGAEASDHTLGPNVSSSPGGARSEPLVLQPPRGLLPHQYPGEGFLSGLMDYDDEGAEYSTPPHTPLRGVGGGSHDRDPTTAPGGRSVGLDSAAPPTRSTGRRGCPAFRDSLFESYTGGRGAQLRMSFGGPQQPRLGSRGAPPTPAGLLAAGERHGRRELCAAVGGSSQQWQVAEALDSTQGFNRFIALAANNNDRGSAERLWHEMCSRGISPDINTLNALLRCLARCAADPDDAHRLVVDACSRGGFSANGTSQRLLEEICFRFEQLNGSGLEGA